MRIVSLIIALLVLGGCGLTPQGNIVRDTVKTKGAEFFDGALENAEFTICSAASIGSVMRRYGGSVEKARAWRTLCMSDPDAIDGLFGIKRAPEGEG